MPIHFATAAAGLVLAVGAATAPAACDVPNAGPTKPASIDWPVAPRPAVSEPTMSDWEVMHPPGGYKEGTCPDGSTYLYAGYAQPQPDVCDFARHIEDHFNH